MSAATHGLVTNPDEADIKLETSNRVISVTQFVDDVQSDPWFPKTLQCYECSLSSVSFPECGTCRNSMEELWTQRDNGWSCSGIDESGGCLSGCSQNGTSELLAGEESTTRSIFHLLQYEEMAITLLDGRDGVVTSVTLTTVKSAPEDHSRSWVQRA